MAIINSSRVEIIPPHQLQLQLLQPSAMAPPSHTTASPRRVPMMVNEKENPFIIPGRYGGNSTSKGGSAIRVPSTDDVFFTNPSTSRKSTNTDVMEMGRRSVLGHRDTNDTALTHTPNAMASGSTSKSQYFQRPPVPAFHTAIPKPSLIPDVFSGYNSNTNTHHHSYIHTNGTSTKRSAETLHDGERGKRRVLEDLRLQEQRAARLDEQEKWRVKWLKSFPTLTFHFEMEAAEGPGKLLKTRTTKMGAKVEQFFSSKVTHLIVKTVTSPTKTKPPPGKLLRGSPKHPFRDPATAGGSLAEKAEQLNIKVWTLKKLSDILDRLAPIGQATTNSHNSLSTLLEDERLHGTRERDANAPRPDWYYFRPGSKYLLVEDATAKHRTILVKEYQSQAQAAKAGLQAGSVTGTPPEYPVLYETFLKLTTSCESRVAIHQIRDRAIRLYIDRLPWKGEQPPGPNQSKRSTSFRSIPGTPSVPDTLPYQHASGNSVVITSNIASTSTANHSPAFIDGVPALGVGKGPMMQMSKRVQVLKGNAKRGLYGSPSDQSSTQSRHPYAAPPPPAAPASATSSSTALGAKGGGKTFMTQSQVIAMLRKQRAPVEYDPEVTIERRIRNREKVDAGYRGIKEQDTSSGYCENCRLRFDDLSVHLASKKHRRFATNSDNFADLDALLKLLRRQINPHFAFDDIPYAPCWDDHTKDYPCEKCSMRVLEDSDGDESTGHVSGMEEWGSQNLDSASPTSTSSSVLSPDKGEDVGDEGAEDGQDGVVIAGEEEEQDDYFDESAEGKEFEE